MEKVPKKVSKLVWLKGLTLWKTLLSLNSEFSIMKRHRTAVHRADGSCLYVHTRSVRRVSGFVLVGMSDKCFGSRSASVAEPHALLPGTPARAEKRA